MNTKELIKRVLEGDVLSLGRLINLVENGDLELSQIMKTIHPHTGKAHRIGITGPPGIGKSTIIDKLTTVFRKEGLKVGIIAVDPTSPFSGGAILGDRVRMQQHYLDPGVFIRSMATRGNLGGLPRTISEVSDILDASGKDIIIIETVGVGQAELDIIKNVDTVVVALATGYGDNIQTMKAGLLEIADIFVVNKADQPGADELIGEIHGMLQLCTEKARRETPVVATQAVANVGIDELSRQIQTHYKNLNETGLLARRRQEQRRELFLRTVERKIITELANRIRQNSELAKYLDEVVEGKIDVYSAADNVFNSCELPASLKHK